MLRFLGKDLNERELVVGTLFALPSSLLIGWWSLAVAGVTALLWALGGAEKSNKLFRRLGVPLAISIACWACDAKFWPLLISVVPGFFALSIGYGIPDPDLRPDRDSGSVLGRWVCKQFKLDYNLEESQNTAALIVRGIIFLLFWLSYGIVLPFVKW